MWCGDIWYGTATKIVRNRNQTPAPTKFSTNYAKINKTNEVAIVFAGQALTQWHPYVNTTISTLILKRNLRDSNIEDTNFWQESLRSVLGEGDDKIPQKPKCNKWKHSTQTLFFLMFRFIFNPGFCSSFPSISQCKYVQDCVIVVAMYWNGRRENESKIYSC